MTYQAWALAACAGFATMMATSVLTCTMLSSYQSKLGTVGGQSVDHSINGCVVISLMIIAYHFSGCALEDSTIVYIIETLCQPVLEELRRRPDATIVYDLIESRLAWTALRCFKFFDVRMFVPDCLFLLTLTR